MGAYPLVVDRVWFAAIDLDDPDEEPVFALHRLACDLELPPLIERSKSKGWHLWWFADQAGWDAWLIRLLLRWMTSEVNRPGVEVFPKQDRLEPGKCGNFIFLPLDGNLVPEARTVFVEAAEGLPPFRNQWDALAHRRRCSEGQVRGVLDLLGLEPGEASNLNTPPSNDKPLGHSVSQPTSSSEGSVKAERTTTSRNSNGGRSSIHTWALPPCARRILAEGVCENQRVICFRLAVHLHRIGLPEDLALSVLSTWAAKNQPATGKRVITQDEIVQQTRDGYSGRYRGYGCDDPVIAQYCAEACPVRNKVGASAQ